MSILAYVNGQRRGKIMEKAFTQGDSIAKENLERGSQESLVPLLNVEDELELVFQTKQSCEDDGPVLAQRMKELGLER